MLLLYSLSMQIMTNFKLLPTNWDIPIHETQPMYFFYLNDLIYHVVCDIQIAFSISRRLSRDLPKHSMRPPRQTYLGKTIYWARTHLWRLFFRIKCDVQDADYFHLAHSEEHWPQRTVEMVLPFAKNNQLNSLLHNGYKPVVTTRAPGISRMLWVLNY